MNFHFSLTLGAIAGLLAFTSDAAAQAPPPKRHDSGAAIAEERAVAFGRKNNWSDCAHELDRAIKLEPNWSDLDYLRATAYGQLAGPEASLRAMRDPEPGHDFGAAAKNLESAVRDFQTYLRLEPDSPMRHQVELAVDVYQERQEKAVAAQAVVDAQLKQTHDEAQGHASASRVLGWSFALGGLALVGGGIACTLRSSSDVAHISRGGFTTGSDIQSTFSEAQTLRGLSYPAFAVGGALVLTGLGFLLFGPSSPPPLRSTGLQIQHGMLVW